MRNLVLLRHALIRAPISAPVVAFASDGPSDRGYLLTEDSAVHVLDMNSGKVGERYSFCRSIHPCAALAVYRYCSSASKARRRATYVHVLTRGLSCVSISCFLIALNLFRAYILKLSPRPLGAVGSVAVRYHCVDSLGAESYGARTRGTGGLDRGRGECRAVVARHGATGSDHSLAQLAANDEGVGRPIRDADTRLCGVRHSHCALISLRSVRRSAERGSISWRGDGQFLVTNVVSTPHPVVPGPWAAKPDAVKREEEKRAPRIVHVWERNGALHSTADRPGTPPPLAPGRRAAARPPHPPETLYEHVVYRCVPLSGCPIARTPSCSHCRTYRPAGPLFGAAATLEGELWLQWYERNGLRHGEFQLRAPSAHFALAAMEYNADSEILAVLLRPAHAHVCKASCLCVCLCCVSVVCAC